MLARLECDQELGQGLAFQALLESVDSVPEAGEPWDVFETEGGIVHRRFQSSNSGWLRMWGVKASWEVLCVAHLACHTSVIRRLLCYSEIVNQFPDYPSLMLCFLLVGLESKDLIQVVAEWGPCLVRSMGSQQGGHPETCSPAQVGPSALQTLAQPCAEMPLYPGK